MGKTKTYIDSTYWKFKERDKADFKDKTNEEINNSIDEILVEREIDPHEQAYIQFEHKKNMEKIDDIYYGALERLNRVQSLVVEGIVKKHRQIEEENQGLSETERDKYWKMSKGQ